MGTLVTNRTPIASSMNKITISQKCQGYPILSSLMPSRDAPHLKQVFLLGLFCVLHFSHFFTIIPLFLSATVHCCRLILRKFGIFWTVVKKHFVDDFYSSMIIIISCNDIYILDLYLCKDNIRKRCGKPCFNVNN